MLSKISQWGVQDHQLGRVTLWACFAAVFFFGFTSTFNMFKVSSIIINISGDLGIEKANRGWIMASYAFASMILAYPGMWIMRKCGVKFTLIVSAFLMLIGSVMGFFAQDTAMFLSSRVVEGCAFGLICVVGPNVVARLFDKKELGKAMGLWSLWMPIGTILAFFLVPAVSGYTGAGSPGDWHPVWIISIVMDVVSIAWLFASVKMPKVAANEGGRYRGKVAGKNYMGSVIVLGVVFVVWAYIYIVNVNTFYAAFLQEEKGLSVFDSSMLPEIIGIIHIVTGIVISMLASKIKNLKAMIWVPYLIVGGLMFLAFTPGTDMVGPYIFCVIMGVLCSCLPMGMRTYIPMLVTDQRRCELGLATMAFFTGVAKCLASVASTCISSFGYIANAQFILAPLAIVAGLIVLFAVKPTKEVRAQRELDVGERSAVEEDLSDHPQGTAPQMA